MEEETTERTVPKQLLPHLFKKGQSGNPAGRPPGPSLKEWARTYLAGMTPEERLEFMEGIPKAEIWKMSEGNPHSSGDLGVSGNIIVQVSEKVAKKHGLA